MGETLSNLHMGILWARNIVHLLSGMGRQMYDVGTNRKEIEKGKACSKQ